MNERQLATRISRGDQQAFTQLVKHYQPIISTYVMRLTDNNILTEEIVQDTFLKVWLKREMLREIENIGGWLYRIAANITYDALRKTSRDAKRMGEFQKNHDADALDDRFTSTEELLLKQQYALLIKQAMNILPEKQLQAFKLVKVQGLSREQAAQQMGVSAETIKSYLAIAVQKIRAFCVARRGALGLLLFYWSNR